MFCRVWGFGRCADEEEVIFRWRLALFMVFVLRLVYYLLGSHEGLVVYSSGMSQIKLHLHLQTIKRMSHNQEQLSTWLISESYLRDGKACRTFDLVPGIGICCLPGSCLSCHERLVAETFAHFARPCTRLLIAPTQGIWLATDHGRSSVACQIFGAQWSCFACGRQLEFESNMMAWLIFQ